jgi:hypothetical protein
LRTLEVGPLFHFTAIQHRTGNPRNRCQARRESSTVAGAGGTWSRDRRRAEEGPRTFSVRGSDLGGDRGRRAIPFASDLRSHPQVNLGPLLRLDSRPACGDATVQPANSVSTTGLTRVSAVRSPEGPLFRAPTRLAGVSAASAERERAGGAGRGMRPGVARIARRSGALDGTPPRSHPQRGPCSALRRP